MSQAWACASCLASPASSARRPASQPASQRHCPSLTCQRVWLSCRRGACGCCQGTQSEPQQAQPWLPGRPPLQRAHVQKLARQVGRRPLAPGGTSPSALMRGEQGVTKRCEPEKKDPTVATPLASQRPHRQRTGSLPSDECDRHDGIAAAQPTCRRFGRWSAGGCSDTSIRLQRCYSLMVSGACNQQTRRRTVTAAASVGGVSVVPPSPYPAALRPVRTVSKA